MVACLSKLYLTVFCNLSTNGTPLHLLSLAFLLQSLLWYIKILSFLVTEEGQCYISALLVFFAWILHINIRISYQFCNYNIWCDSLVRIKIVYLYIIQLLQQIFALKIMWPQYVQGIMILISSSFLLHKHDIHLINL